MEPAPPATRGRLDQGCQKGGHEQSGNVGNLGPLARMKLDETTQRRSCTVGPPHGFIDKPARMLDESRLQGRRITVRVGRRGNQKKYRFSPEPVLQASRLSGYPCPEFASGTGIFSTERFTKASR